MADTNSGQGQSAGRALTGKERAIAAKEARQSARRILVEAQLCLRRVDRDRWQDAEYNLDYVIADAKNLRDLITELKL